MSSVLGSHFGPSCNKCKRSLEPAQDRLKTKDGYRKNCKRCRDKNNSTKRRTRGLVTASISTPSFQIKKIHGPVSLPSRTRTDAPWLRQFNVQATSTALSQPTGRWHPSTGSPSSTLHVSTSTPRPKTQTTVPECSVCGDTFTAEHFPSLNQFGNTSWDRIVCPSEGCGVLITHEQMITLASAETYARFDELSTRSVLSAIPNFRHCLRPGCNSGQIHDSGIEGNIFRCGACDFLVCATHDEAFHVGETCEEYDQEKSFERKIQDDASVVKIKELAKKCPGSECGVWIEKNDGCDHMTCRRCRFEFCWTCLVPYAGTGGIFSAGNSVHEKTCQHYRPIIPVPVTADTSTNPLNRNPWRRIPPAAAVTGI